MNPSHHIDHLLHDYLDGTLTPAQRQVVEAHLQTCDACRAEHDQLAALLADLTTLPPSIDPARDLWPGIEARLAAPAVTEPTRPLPPERTERPARAPRSGRATRLIVVAAVLAVLVVGLGALWLLPNLFAPAWDVTRLDGTPRVGSHPLTGDGTLRRGEWLETDAHSRAALKVGLIGNVDVEPNTRLQLLEAQPSDHRLALTRGTIHARIWAPPRLFFVETPSALAIDLGCAYTLKVDSTGGNLLHVTSGYVALEHEARTTVVSAGSMSRTHPRLGPGTPFDEDATPAFRRALYTLDFEAPDSSAVTTLLAEARRPDAATLFLLLYRVDPSDRARLYDRLVELKPEPDGVTREGMLRAEPRMIDVWKWYLGLHIDIEQLFPKDASPPMAPAGLPPR